MWTMAHFAESLRLDSDDAVARHELEAIGSARSP
jgi:hypothetical protein